jgi:lipoic acid synthetase
MKGLLSELGLRTVCQGALCPNLGACFSEGTATFLILGSVCTRRCRFCAIPHGHPDPPDPDEPARVAEAARRLGLRTVVVTSVTRDDLADGGAACFAETIRSLRELPGVRVEVLVPDFRGSERAVETVVKAGPRVFNHNVETVPGLYYRVRPEADYRTSLDVLRCARIHAPGLLTKSGLMLGLGEEPDEVRAVLGDLRAVGCDLLTIGQYLSPSKDHVETERFVPPEEFARWQREARDLGFRGVSSGPLVRSSFQAHRFLEEVEDGSE